MKRNYLSGFEGVVLLIVAVLNGQEYELTITEKLEKQTGRSVSLSAVNVAF
jgi:hypothetical protein